MATAFLELLELDNQLAISRQPLDSHRHGLRLANARFAEGIASQLDVRQAESLLAGTAMDDFERRVHKAFGLVAFTCNCHLADHMRRVSNDLDIDLDTAMLWGLTAHFNVDPPILSGRRLGVSSGETSHPRGGHS